jgi:hypothetical protein
VAAEGGEHRERGDDDHGSEADKATRAGKIVLEVLCFVVAAWHGGLGCRDGVGEEGGTDRRWA